MLRGVPGFVVRAVGAMAALGACTLTHPLDRYSDGVDAVDGGGQDAIAPDAGDGCPGDPRIVAPSSGAVVGASFRLTATAPGCLTTMIFYIDGNIALHIAGHSVDQDIPIGIGTHSLNVNGWAGTEQAHSSTHVKVTRTK
jgi:hypothetical protein